jgi:hypothetical protein
VSNSKLNCITTLERHKHRVYYARRQTLFQENLKRMKVMSVKFVVVVDQQALLTEAESTALH